jgi:hypothetical protein
VDLLTFPGYTTREEAVTPEEFKKAVQYNKKQLDKAALSMEQLTMLTYAYQLYRGDLEDDAYCGPLTRGTLDNLYTELFAETAPEQWQPYDGPLAEQPRSRREVYRMFGDPGKLSASESWKRENIIYCHKNEGNRLPGVPTKWWVAIHKDVEPYLREALRRARIAAPDYKITRIGGYVWRPIRHKVGNPLSMHSWGIAVDINPHENFAKTFKKGEAPKAWSPEYNAIWPNGVPKAFVEAFTSCGFAWGSDWDEDGLVHDHTFLDPMHFEWVQRREGTDPV